MNTAIAVGRDRSFGGGGFSEKTTPLMAAFAAIGFLLLFAAVRIMCRHHSHASRHLLTGPQSRAGRGGSA